jgi:mediator of RNA polymerase II transcription subunit 13, fungi type
VDHKDVASRLSRILSSAVMEEKNFVVYFIYPTDNSALLVHICSAFQHLFNLYRKALSERRLTTANELVLQLIPLDLVSSSTSLAVPLPSEYFRLAMEVYDRCIDFVSSSSTPAIMLEQPLPKTIDFKLNATPSASLLQENTCLHVGYAQSIDDRWITATWTDNRGTQQMTASYCLGRKNEPISMPFSEVANEIWATTLDFIASKKIHWRIMIARVGVMDQSEVDFWTTLASAESDAQFSLTLIAVQTDPSLRLLPASITLIPNASSATSVATPVSTPQALQSSMVSPGDAATPAREIASAATPIDGPAEPDSDSRLIDYTDQSWGAVLSHRLNNSNSLMELNPALISGYLLKRGGVNSDDPPIIMEVNILYSEVVGNPRTFHEGLLREILGYYRGLGTLARVRGLVDSVEDVRPWHIAAAEKAVKALYMLM